MKFLVLLAIALLTACDSTAQPQPEPADLVYAEPADLVYADDSTPDGAINLPTTVGLGAYCAPGVYGACRGFFDAANKVGVPAFCYQGQCVSACTKGESLETCFVESYAAFCFEHGGTCAAPPEWKLDGGDSKPSAHAQYCLPKR